MVHAREQADPPLRQPGEEPHLPQWPGPVQAAAAQLLGDAQQRGLIPGRGHVSHPHMVCQVERRGVHPQRPAQPVPRHVEHLPEPGDQVQSGFDFLPRRLDPEPAVRVDQAGAVENGQRADVLRPALIRPQHEPVLGGQPLHRWHLLVPQHRRGGGRSFRGEGPFDAGPMTPAPDGHQVEASIVAGQIAARQPEARPWRPRRSANKAATLGQG